MTAPRVHFHELKQEGFDILFEAFASEDDPTTADFPEEGMLAEIIRKMDTFELYWFEVKVSASKHGIELASEHLAGCVYNSYEEFYTTENGYWDDMVATVINNAHGMIQRLSD